MYITTLRIQYISYITHYISYITPLSHNLLMNIHSCYVHVTALR